MNKIPANYTRADSLSFAFSLVFSGEMIILSGMAEYTVTIAFDDEAQKWYARNDDIPVILEDYSIDVLISRVKLAVPEMLEINNMPHAGIHLLFRMEAQAVVA